jgi:xanthine dehydrogenase accessory factor
VDTLRSAARAWLAEGRRAALVQVLEARGSVPREAGTRMLVAAEGVVLGTIGGGRLEWEAIAAARAALDSAAAFAPFHTRVALGPTLGQCCGGALTLRTEALGEEALAAWADAPPLFTLHLHGAGHVGRAIARLLATLPCRVAWIDERDDAFPPPGALGGQAPHIERRTVEAPEAEVALAAPGDFHLVLTHSHAHDLRIALAIARRADFGFFGLIGSKTKRAKFEARLEERGVPREVLARLVCPIGIEGIGGKAPEVIAVAVVAQLLRAAGA